MKPPASQGDPNHLPDNVPDCHALINSLRETVKSLVERIAELEKQVGRRNRMLFGKRSAKVSSTVLTGTGKAVYEANAEELEEEQKKLQIVPEESKHGGGGLTAPAHAPTEKRFEHVIANPAELACPCCGTTRTVLGFRASPQLDIIKAVFQLLKHVQYTYSCPKCQAEVITAPKPEQPFGKGYATGGLVAHIATAKFHWHQPLYRQQQSYRAQSVPIARSTMCRLLKEGAELLELIVRRMHKHILTSSFIQSDSTTMPVIKKGLGKTHRGAIWIYRGDDSQPYIVYDFTETGEGKHPERMLAGVKGVLLSDRAPAVNGVINTGAAAANCWAHASRYFEDARDSEPDLADHALAIIKGLFDIERVAAQLPAVERLDLRQRLWRRRIEALKEWLDEQTQ